MPRDLSKYLHRLDAYDDLTTAQKLAIAQAVWSLIEHLCDHAMHLDSTQLALGISPFSDSFGTRDEVESGDTSTTQFRRAATETACIDRP